MEMLNILVIILIVFVAADCGLRLFHAIQYKKMIRAIDRQNKEVNEYYRETARLYNDVLDNVSVQFGGLLDKLISQISSETASNNKQGDNQ